MAKIGPSRDAGAGLKPRGAAETMQDTVGRDPGRGSSSVIKRNLKGTRPFGGDRKATDKY